MSGKIKLGEKSKVNIKWKTLPIDYSHEAEEEIRATFAKKYGILKDNITVEPIYILKNKTGDNIDISNTIIDDIQEPEYQQKLFKEYIEERNVTNYDFNKIIEIDNMINAKIDYEVYDKHKHYFIKWIKWSNFMSYGENNFFDFSNISGLALLTSEPANQGGKTTFCLDLFRFLLFGKVTSRESDWVLAKVFNKHKPEATEVVVEGCIIIDGQEYVIKRTITRPSLARRTEKSKVSQKVEYYHIVNGSYVDMIDDADIENDGEQTTKETNKTIKEAIGNEKDFDLMICVDSDNLKSLISLKDTDRGRLISRWIGLLPLEEKEKIAKDIYNHNIVPSLMLNKFNKQELIEELEEYNTNNSDLIAYNEKLEIKKNDSVLKKDRYTKEREELLLSKQQIDESLTNVDVVTLQTKLDQIKNDGLIKREEKKRNEDELKSFGDVEYSENEYQQILVDDKNNAIELNNVVNKYQNITKEIESLKNSEYCPTCGAKLKNVDNSELISKKNIELNELIELGKKYRAKSSELEQRKVKIEEKRENFKKKSKLELLIITNDIEINRLLGEYRDTEKLLRDIEKNKVAIAKNNEINIKLNNNNELINTETNIINQCTQLIVANNTNIESNKKSIKQINTTIETIEKEEILIRNWKIYLDIIGKNGISKLVLRNALPLINAELKRILNGVCDFYVEVKIDDDNSVSFYLVHDGISSNLASGSGFEKTVASLALRSVLSKISTFSKPSFVVFDEVLGGVAIDNYDNVKLLYDKIVSDYQCILFITHNSVYKEWANTIISITKENNISKIKSIEN